jgi:hypothetical protein
MRIIDCQIYEVRFCFSLNKCIAKMTVAERKDYESQIADYLDSIGRDTTWFRDSMTGKNPDIWARMVLQDPHRLSSKVL